MNFDLDLRRIRLSVGELADFAVGPRDPGDGRVGLWRAQLGAEWHRRLRVETASAESGAEFEVVVEGSIALRGWTIALTGRIDQLIRTGERVCLREIKTVSRPLPADEGALRADYPAYFIQLAAYAALLGPSPSRSAELLFVEADSGLAQTVALAPSDAALFRGQLERVAEFLDLRFAARDRRRTLNYQSPFKTLRPGQETIREELTAAIHGESAALLLEAPTGFGKTGVLLEFALDQLRSGQFERVVYLTGKSTGQLQVVRTLASMTPSLSLWHVRNKAEHCVNSVFHCVRGACAFIEDVEARWSRSGLSRFTAIADQPNDMESLRGAGRGAAICPYEITRAALAFNDFWIGDYNYVFAPANRGLFYNQLGFHPERTLLLIDEAHNLPGRVASAYSHGFSIAEAHAALDTLAEVGSPAALAAAWSGWTQFLSELEPTPALAPEAQEEARRHFSGIAETLVGIPLDFAALGPRCAELLWKIPAVIEQLESAGLEMLWWCPRPGELTLTCLDAAASIGAALGEFGGVVLATATPGPTDVFSEGCGIALHRLEASTPWREGATDVAFDMRVDTTFNHRGAHYGTTAGTVAAICRAAGAEPQHRCVAVFFPSYAYADAIAGELASREPGLSIAIQPRRADLAAQAAWVEDSLANADAMFLVLGSSFSESIDLLGGRVTHAMVVGPALPEVNPVQRARMAVLAERGREAAFHRVYRVPGMLKVNQAIGRLVRAPGQRAKVLLHCRRFTEPGYAELLAPDYRAGVSVRDDPDLDEWLSAKLIQA